LKVCESPWFDMRMRIIIRVENILSICYELWLDKQ
jgi:hypothetical protein